MNPNREYLSEMDIFKVISESKSIRMESKIHPEKGISPKNIKKIPNKPEENKK